MTDKTLFENLCNRVDAEFAILSDASRQTIKDMIMRMADDAFYRGRTQALDQPPVEKKFVTDFFPNEGSATLRCGSVEYLIGATVLHHMDTALAVASRVKEDHVLKHLRIAVDDVATRALNGEKG